jgi:hypothetical protein
LKVLRLSSLKIKPVYLNRILESFKDNTNINEFVLSNIIQKNVRNLNNHSLIAFGQNKGLQTLIIREYEEYINLELFIKLIIYKNNLKSIDFSCRSLKNEEKIK